MPCHKIKCQHPHLGFKLWLLISFSFCDNHYTKSAFTHYYMYVHTYTHLQSVLIIIISLFCLVSWGCRIQRLHLCSGVRPHPHANKCPRYDTKQSDDEVPVMLELWGMWSTSSFSSVPGPLWLAVLAPDMVPIVEKRKISYFVLARYLIRHRISPNQDDISHSARTFISGYQTGERPNTLSSAGGGD